jgi:hypothetical protein
LLKGAAIAHPLVIKDPAPQVWVVTLSPGALSYGRAADWIQIRSDPAVSISSVLAFATQ